jgi:hypothetical protein
MVARAHSAANCTCSGRGAHWSDTLPARHAAALCQALLPATEAATPRRCRRGAGRVAVQCVQAVERPASAAPGALDWPSTGPRGLATSLEGPPTWMTGLELPRYDRAAGSVELVVAGAGPSGLAVADRVSQAGAPLLQSALPVFQCLSLHCSYRHPPYGATLLAVRKLCCRLAVFPTIESLVVCSQALARPRTARLPALGRALPSSPAQLKRLRAPGVRSSRPRGAPQGSGCAWWTPRRWRPGPTTTACGRTSLRPWAWTTAWRSSGRRRSCTWTAARASARGAGRARARIGLGDCRKHA